MKAKVVINARFLSQPITGTQRFAIELCRGLKNLRDDMILLAPDNIAHKDLAKELDVKIIGKIRKGLIWEQIELPIYLKKIGNPLLINLCNLAPLLYNNNLVSILDLSFKLHPEWFSNEFSYLYNFFVPRIAAKARRVITISESSREDILKYYNIQSGYVDIIYPSVSNTFLNYPNQELKNLYGKYILAVSSIDPRKNFKGLVHAYKAANFSDVNLVIVGSEHKVFATDGLKELVANDNRIFFTGYVNDSELVSLYKHAMVFAYPSFFEGFGIPPLEAMACGCPTVVSNTTSLPEVCGDASIYVDPFDIDSIKNGLVRLIENESLRKELVEKGFNRLQYFDWQASSKKLSNVIDELI